MPRYILDICYKGTHYSGWQIQPNASTVQEEVSKALSILLREDIHLMGAGRTDAGVHARQMIAHFECSHSLPSTAKRSLNGILPDDIAIKQILIPNIPDFHARFTALSRAYTYHIVTQKSPLKQEFAYCVLHPLDFRAMEQAATIIKEYEDFGCFCKAHADNKTNLCKIFHSYWERGKHEEYIYHVKANRFLRGMVRAIVGTLLLVGKGKLTEAQFRTILKSGDRNQAGPSAPAHGLFLDRVGYPLKSMMLS